MALLELSSSDVEIMYDLLDDGDGTISLDKCAAGCLRLKGAARSNNNSYNGNRSFLELGPSQAFV